jgi:hypothetical protein
LMQASSYGILKTTSRTNGNCCTPAQKQEALTLGDIAPTWHGRLLERLPRAGLRRILWHHQMALPETCIVGEAYGFSSSSYMRDCDRCTVFSQAFLRHFRAGSHDALRKAGRHFVIHWNGSHREVTSRLNSKVRRRLQWYDAFVRFDNHVLITYK